MAWLRLLSDMLAPGKDKNTIYDKAYDYHKRTWYNE
jgi:hypothetical protein